MKRTGFRGRIYLQAGRSPCPERRKGKGKGTFSEERGNISRNLGPGAPETKMSKKILSTSTGVRNEMGYRNCCIYVGTALFVYFR